MESLEIQRLVYLFHIKIMYLYPLSISLVECHNNNNNVRNYNLEI